MMEPFYFVKAIGISFLIVFTCVGFGFWGGWDARGKGES